LDGSGKGPRYGKEKREEIKGREDVEPIQEKEESQDWKMILQVLGKRSHRERKFLPSRGCLWVARKVNMRPNGEITGVLIPARTTSGKSLDPVGEPKKGRGGP